MSEAKRFNFLTFLLIAVLLGSATFLGIKFFQLQELETEVTAKESERDRIVLEVEKLNDEVNSLRYSGGTKVAVNGRARALDGMEIDGLPVFDFTVWIDLSSPGAMQLQDVTYLPVGSEVPFDTRSSDTKSSGFAIDYRGNCCPESVDVELRFDDESSEQINVDLCYEFRKKGRIQPAVCTE